MPYSSVVVEGVALLCFPPTDKIFAALARRLLASAEGDTAALERGLRQMYPRAVVRERDRLASFGGPAWYVYRDGRYSPFGAAHSWWADSGVARLVIGDDGQFLDANDAALALLDTSIETVRAAKVGDFSVPELQEIVPWIIQLLRDTGELHSTAIMRPPGGKPDVPVEFHFVLDGDGKGRHVSIMRPVPVEAVADDPPAAGQETSATQL